MQPLNRQAQRLNLRPISTSRGRRGASLFDLTSGFKIPSAKGNRFLYVNLSRKWPLNHGSVWRSCYKTLTKEPELEDSGVCKVSYHTKRTKRLQRITVALSFAHVVSRRLQCSLRSWRFSLMKEALPNCRNFICNFQRLTHHLPTFGGFYICRARMWYERRNRRRFFLASGLRAFLHLFLQLRRSIFCPLAKQTVSYALIRTCRLLLVGKRPKYLAAHAHSKKTLHACIPCSQASFLGNWN